MKNRLKYLLLLLVFQILTTKGITQTKLKDFKPLFPEISFDTLHVYPLKFDSTIHSIVPVKYLKNFGFYKSDEAYFARNTFYLDTEKKLKVYLIQNTYAEYEMQSVYICIFRAIDNKLLFRKKIAVYQLLEGAYERIQNAWIADFNSNGMREIGVLSKLADFEMETADTRNISSSEQYIFFYKKGKIEKKDWDYRILKEYTLQANK